MSHHTDAGVFTIIIQRVAGLEVYSGTKQYHNDGEWISVIPIIGALTINIGDMLQVWSNNYYKAPEHRVLASINQPRYSAPLFFNPDYNTIIQPIVDTQNNAKSIYNPINWGYFRRQRFLGDFQDFGKEIQIEDYLIKDITENEMK